MGLGHIHTLLASGARVSRDIEELYRIWWAGDRGSGWEGVPDDRREIPVERHSTEVWNLVEVLPDGTASVGRGGEVAQAPVGEWLADGPHEVRVSRRSLWREGSYVWRASSRLQPAIARRWAVRIYLADDGCGHSEGHLGALCAALDDEGMWFEAKAWLGRTARRDHTVVWVQASDAHTAVRIARESGRSSQSPLSAPPLALKLGDGAIGIAHDPPVRASLGLRVCGAVVSAGDLEAGGSWESRWRSACGYYDLVPEKPWRHPGVVDPYGLWESLEAEWGTT